MGNLKNKQNQSFLHIPDFVIKNPEITPIDFTILLYFKLCHFTSGKKDVFQIDLQKMKSDILVKDNRTLKKSFENLYEMGYVDKIIIRQNIPIDVQLNKEIILSEPYTRLPTSLLNYIHQIKHTGIRLLYYYESYIIRKKGGSFCFVSFKKINNETNLTDKTIDRYNKILVKHKLLRVTRHKTELDEDDGYKLEKYNNHYYVNIDKI